MKFCDSPLGLSQSQEEALIYFMFTRSLHESFLL
jgi:hypothetical protein